MKNYLPTSLCVLCVSMPSFAEMCTDFDDNQNLIEYECGTSLESAIKAQEKAKQLEQKRIAKEEKVKQETERAEKARIEAEEKAKQETERAEKARIEAEEKAKRDAESAKWWAEKKQQWHNFWQPYTLFVAFGNEGGNFAVMEANGTNGTDAENHPTGLNVQIGILEGKQDSKWKYGLRLESTNITGKLENLNMQLERQEYYADVVAQYNILYGLNLYGGLGVGYANIDKQYSVPQYYTENEGLFATKMFIGLEYDIIKYFGVFAELSHRFIQNYGGMGFVVGGKIIF